MCSRLFKGGCGTGSISRIICVLGFAKLYKGSAGGSCGSGTKGGRLRLSPEGSCLQGHFSGSTEGQDSMIIGAGGGTGAGGGVGAGAGVGGGSLDPPKLLA
mmetsp:Transcript_9629/g.21145  ORF Transcript_9629/g.21145 Transcript_9629/m.21145 type:complete len:101 (-) Transcript_9629:1639-1941(-)